MKYMTKPCEIEAVRFTGDNLKEIEGFTGRKCVGARFEGSFCTEVAIETPTRWSTASVGDYIVKEEENVFYPCKSDVFEGIYEAVMPID